MEQHYRIIQNGSGEHFLLRLDKRPVGDSGEEGMVWVPLASKVSRDELQRVLSDIERGDRDKNGIRVIRERTIHVGVPDVITATEA